MKFVNMNFAKIFAVLMKTLAEQEDAVIDYKLTKKEKQQDKTA